MNDPPQYITATEIIELNNRARDEDLRMKSKALAALGESILAGLQIIRRRQMSRIIKFESENILPLKAISITPDGSVVKIAGPNDAGKTAILRGIWMSLGGKGEIPDDAIREGQDSGFVELTIGDNGTIEYTARLNLTRRPDGTIKRHEIILKNAEGRTETSPMTLIKDMLGFGRGQFDPLVFRDAKPAVQIEMLKTALGLDFSVLDAEYDKQYEQRTKINGEAKLLEAQIPEDDPEAPDKEVSVAELSTQHEQAVWNQTQNTNRETKLNTTVTDGLRADEGLSDLQEELIELELKVVKKKQQIVAQITCCENIATALNEAKDSKIYEVDDTEAIKEKIDNAESENARARAKIERAEKTAQVDELKSKAEVITTCLATIKATKEKMISDADFPIPGVVIEGKEILIKGHPLANQGSAAILRFGLLLVIKSDPKLRICTMDEGLGKLDDESIEMAEAICDEYNFQLWLTGPRAVGEGCVLISAGEVVEG